MKINEYKKITTLHQLLLLIFLLTLIWSAINPHNYFIWSLEAVPAIILVTVLVAVFNKFRFTNFVYILVLLHCIILFVGAKYSYAEVPLFNWIQDFFEHSRNNYDKLGHFAQGFVPAAIAREILIRRNIINGKSWLNFLTVCFCLSFSALYEIFEWTVAVLTGDAADDFLGMQGDIWDTQSDMLFALIGASCLVLIFARHHDKQIAKLNRG